MFSTRTRSNVMLRRLLASTTVVVLSLAAIALWAADEPAKPVVGYWQGALKTGAIELRIGIHITKEDGGQLAATFDSPDQGAKNIAVDSATRNGNQVRVEAKPYGIVFEGKLTADASAIEGHWKQAGQALALRLKRLEKPPEYRRPQEPQKPYPYREEQVSYENKTAKVKLAGTLTLPPADRPVPAVLLLTGSGAQDRDESILGHKPFWVLADYLTRKGIAVLRVDDRGVGDSGGDTTTSTTEDFAGDAMAGVEYLKSRKEIDPRRIGLVGHSEGAMIAAMAASRSAEIAFIVMLAGTGVPGDQIVLHQGERIAKAEGADPKRIAAARELQAKIFEIMRREPNAAAATALILQTAAESEAVKGAATAQARQAVESQIKAQAGLMLTPWFRYFAAYDPAPTLRKVRCPVLALNGQLDLQVDPKQNLPPIERALTEGGNPDFKVRELAGLNHLFQHCTNGSPTEYGKIDETMSPDVLELVAGWIAEKTK